MAGNEIMAGNDESQQSKLNELRELLEKVEQHQTYNQIDWYKTVPKQYEFHDLGKTKRQRCLMAGNQLGKSLSAGMEMAMHLNGLYPDWWPGHRFNKPIHAWASGVTTVSTRDNPQRILLGRGRNWGSGTIPSDYLNGKPILARGVPDGVDSVYIHHVSGGVSSLKFKSYDQGREKWQGDTLDLIWCDEEPEDEGLYDEGITRLNKRKGLMMLTFTPLMGMTDIVKRFMEPSPDDKGKRNRALIHMTLEDAEFYSDGEKEEIEGQYSEAVKRARVKGLPTIGEGLIYPFEREDIECEPFAIPSYFRRICGLDHGINHPSALVWVAYDPDGDTVYLYDCWKSSDATIADRAYAWKKRGDWIPLAWPHDVGNRDAASSGKPFADLYKEAGMLMLSRSARISPDSGGSQPREPIIETVYSRMKTGRFKVFNHLNDWFSEQQRYHRKDGQVVDKDDDLISATHYAVMELRNARPMEVEFEFKTYADGLDYNPLG